MDSIEHLEIYINIIKDILKKAGSTDFTKFEIALSHDKPHYLKWEYPTTIEKPTIEYLLKEFSLPASIVKAPRKIQKLEFEYIYIWATSIAQILRKDKLISSDKEPIYFNIHGNVISSKEVKEGSFDKSKTTIESIIKVDLERTSNMWLCEDNLFMKKLSVENGYLKFYHQDIFQATTGLIRVLVAYQKRISFARSNPSRATELGNTRDVKNVSAVYMPLNGESLKSLNN